MVKEGEKRKILRSGKIRQKPQFQKTGNCLNCRELPGVSGSCRKPETENQKL
jgi:hypothetical protein